MVDSTSFNSSSNSSSNTSVPTVYPTPQSDFSLQISQFLEQLGQQQMQWAMQEYARAGTVTDAQIHNYLQMANQGAGLAGQTLNRYENTYAPLEDQYAREAQTYASDGRIQHDMGRAEASAKQAADHAKINSENELQSFGIDPSSGRYADLIMANNTKSAADAAAAGEQARVNTEAEGQRRKTNAIMMGQQLPGAAVNALNSAYQGIAGAENAALGLANTGANLTTSASKFFDPAVHPTQPLFGNNSTGKSIGGSSGASAGGGGSGGGGRSSGDPFPKGGSAPDNFQSSRGNTNPASLGQNAPGYQAHPVSRRPGIQEVPEGAGGTNSYGDPLFDPAQSPQGWDDRGFEGVDAWSQDGINGANSYNDPTFDYGQTSNGGWDTGGFGDYGGAGAGQGTSSWGDSYPTYDAQPSYSGNDGSGWGDSGGGYDSGSSGGYDSGSSGGFDDYYAKGGPIGGGAVPASMSPSGGRQTDDIQATIPQTGGKAMINAGEFVLPRDVVAWKGQEFFQKMIQQARKARTGAPAKPSTKPSGGFNAR
jgi:hypothetical protein